MTEGSRCRWCGEPIKGPVSLCSDCISRRMIYGQQPTPSWTLKRLLKYRNVLLDLMYNMPNAVGLPTCLRDKYNLVTEYIALK